MVCLGQVVYVNHQRAFTRASEGSIYISTGAPPKAPT